MLILINFRRANTECVKYVICSQAQFRLQILILVLRHCFVHKTIHFNMS